MCLVSYWSYGSDPASSCHWTTDIGRSSRKGHSHTPKYPSYGCSSHQSWGIRVPGTIASICTRCMDACCIYPCMTQSQPILSHCQRSVHSRVWCPDGRYPCGERMPMLSAARTCRILFSSGSGYDYWSSTRISFVPWARKLGQVCCCPHRTALRSILLYSRGGTGSSMPGFRLVSSLSLWNHTAFSCILWRLIGRFLGTLLWRLRRMSRLLSWTPACTGAFFLYCYNLYRILYGQVP